VDQTKEELETGKKPGSLTVQSHDDLAATKPSEEIGKKGHRENSKPSNQLGKSSSLQVWGYRFFCTVILAMVIRRWIHGRRLASR